MFSVQAGPQRNQHIDRIRKISRIKWAQCSTEYRVRVFKFFGFTLIMAAGRAVRGEAKWSGQQDSILRPSGPKPDALPDCAMPRSGRHERVREVPITRSPARRQLRLQRGRKM